MTCDPSTAWQHKLTAEEARERLGQWLPELEAGRITGVTLTHGWAHALSFIPESERETWAARRQEIERRLNEAAPRPK